MRNNIIRIIYKAAFFIVLMILSVFFTYAADPGEPVDCDIDADPFCGSNEPVPIDGGASILVAAGVAFGLKKAYDKRKQNKEADIA